MSGGYPYEPVGIVQDDLYCVVCLNLMKDAMQLDNCDHGMCNICLQSLARASQQKNNNPLCPVCRKEININKIHPAKMVNKMIKGIKVRCLHVVAGCKWQGDVLDAQPHLESKCLYQEIPCSYFQSGCDIKIARHSLEAHLQRCEFRQAACDYCEESFLHNVLPVHFQKCEKFPVLCPHGCNMMVVRKSTHDHLQTCPELSVECPFKDVGCLQKMLRKGLHDHEVSAVTSHLLSTKRKLESELQTTKTELVVAKGKLDKVEEKLAHAEEEQRKTKMMLEETCESLKELSLKSKADIEFEVMIWENYKVVISSYKEKFQRKLSDNLIDILSKLLNSSEAVNDAFADLVVSELHVFATKFFSSLPSVEEYIKQIEGTFSQDFQKLKCHVVTKAILELSFFKAALLQECENYRGNRANTILMICLRNGVGTTYLGKYQCIKLDGNIGEPRLIDSKITIIRPGCVHYDDRNSSVELMSLTDDNQTFQGTWWINIYVPKPEQTEYQNTKNSGFIRKMPNPHYMLLNKYFGSAFTENWEANLCSLTIKLPDGALYAKNGYALLRDCQLAELPWWKRFVAIND